MTTEDLIDYATTKLGGDQKESALARLYLARKALERGDTPEAKRHALMSLQYSVGLMSPDYARTVRE